MQRRVSVIASSFVVAVLMQGACGDDRSSFGTESPPQGDFVDLDAGSSSDAASEAAVADEGCSSSQTAIERIPVVIQLVVDESGSMNEGGKWKATREALLASVADMRATAEPSTFVGIHYYTTNRDVAPRSLVDVSHYEDLVAAIDVPSAKGGLTPTAAALTKGFGILEDFQPPKDAGLSTKETKRILVLLSDGVPTDGSYRCEQITAEKFQMAPPLGPIRTFSVGIGFFPSGGATYDASVMGRIAQAGGTAPAGCNPEATELASVCHYQITPGPGQNDATRQALIAALDEIRALSASCEFSFTRNASTDLGNVTVTVTDRNGTRTTIPKDAENGWTFDDETNPTKVVLRGAACSTTTGKPSGRVDVVIGCRAPR